MHHHGLPSKTNGMVHIHVDHDGLQSKTNLMVLIHIIIMDFTQRQSDGLKHLKNF